MTTDSLHIIVLILSILIAIFLLYFLLSSRKKRKRGLNEKNCPEPRNGKPCPLCGKTLARGERVHSIIYPGTPDKLMEIYGCPYCETAPKGREKPSTPNERKCPVCRKTMAPDSVLIARVFEKPGKTHVHVLGCSGCYRGRTRIKKE